MRTDRARIALGLRVLALLCFALLIPAAMEDATMAAWDLGDWVITTGSGSGLFSGVRWNFGQRGLTDSLWAVHSKVWYPACLVGSGFVAVRGSVRLERWFTRRVR